MRTCLYKEMTLSASPLSYLFLTFSAMTLLPGYPILMGAFFISFGVFQTFQTCRENNDILYSALLPIEKRDVVRSKYAFALFIEGAGFVLMCLFTLLRMTVLCDVTAYRNNALMTANPMFLGFSLLIFGLFNAVFIGGFFKTAHYFAKPFILFITVSLLTVGIAETLHHIPGLAAVNTFGFESPAVQLPCLAAGAVAFILLTTLSEKRAIAHFEKIDL